MRARIFAAVLTVAGLLSVAAAPAVAAGESPMPAFQNQPKGPTISYPPGSGSGQSGYAFIFADGSLGVHVNAKATSHITTGDYEVDFNSDISKCGLTATSYGSPVIMEVEPRSGNVKGVFVHEVDPSNTSIDAPFYVNVTC